ncbi:MAG: hypothetical protein FDX18_06750 [Chlorobium sp.]|nr:MAG: hypothetical protein FDX18_06750 [Chlorobium sp.]
MDSEASKKKPWYEVVATLTPLILGLAVAGVGAVFTQVYNFRQLQLNELNLLQNFHPLLVSEKEYDREFAYASFTALGYGELAAKIIKIKEDPAGRAIVEEIKQSGNAAAKEEASTALTRIPARVYVQIASKTQQQKAEEIVSALKQLGFVVPGVENMEGKVEPPKSSEVRYFNAEDKAAAETIAAFLRKNGMLDASTKNVTRFKVKPGSLEVWFSAQTK